jgi:uncharacterized protein (TIGR02145 family)
MERLPLLSGATLTATSPGGKVIEETNNNQGVWVVGNARSAGSFSATVKLLTSVKDVGGACVYGSNYPPVGKYISASEITFTGTPEYKVVLERNDESTYTVTVGKNESLLIPSGEAALSFTDKTGVPGIMKCVPMTGDIDFTVPTNVSKGFATSFEATTSGFTLPQAVALIYTWSAPGFSPDTHTGATYTPTASVNAGTYPMTLTVRSEGYCDVGKTKDVDVLDCTAPASTVTFTAFNPCSNTTGDYWFLTDERESNNVQTYKVKLMADGRIWMVQDLKFGDKCNKTTFTGSTSDQQGKISYEFPKYYGDCTAATTTSTPSNRGYLYDWAAAMNKAGAYYGSSANVGCSGTNSGVNCQGICPNGWHVPTLAESQGLITSVSNTGMASSNGWEGVLGGVANDGASLSEQGKYVKYRTSQYYDPSRAYNLAYEPPNWIASIRSEWTWRKSAGGPLRCIWN